MTNLESWVASLREGTSRDAVPEVTSNDGHVVAVVWTERAVPALRRTARQLGIPDDALRIIRPSVFLNPYPGDDPRNAEAHAKYLAENFHGRHNKAATFVTSMPPIAGDNPHTLVLGSMPGELSLTRGEYYANPRNLFWSLAENILGVPRTAPYQDRVNRIMSAGVALWDVLKHCSRIGSLDRRIDKATEVPNNFAEFFDTFPSIVRVVFNGRKAGYSFRRLVLATLHSDIVARIECVDAPSTSPANTRISRDALIGAWRSALLS